MRRYTDPASTDALPTAIVIASHGGPEAKSSAQRWITALGMSGWWPRVRGRDPSWIRWIRCRSRPGCIPRSVGHRHKAPAGTRCRLRRNWRRHAARRRPRRPEGVGGRERRRGPRPRSRCSPPGSNRLGTPNSYCHIGIPRCWGHRALPGSGFDQLILTLGGYGVGGARDGAGRDRRGGRRGRWSVRHRARRVGAGASAGHAGDQPQVAPATLLTDHRRRAGHRDHGVPLRRRRRTSILV